MARPKKPIVSVLMPLKNAGEERFLKARIESTQICGDSVELELIVCCATTKDKDAIDQITKETRVKPFVQEWSRLGIALQVAADHAKGKYICVQLPNTWYQPDALAALAAELDDNVAADFVYGYTRTFQPSQWIRPQSFNRADFWRGSYPSLNGYMYRREALDMCRYDEAPELRNGLNGGVFDVADRDFMLQMLNAGLDGYWLEKHTLNVAEFAKSTEMARKNRARVNWVLKERFGEYRID